MFDSDLSVGGNATLHRIAEAVGLDLQRFEADWRSEATRSKVTSDVELGIRLEVDATPTVFLNGRRIRDLSIPVLEILVDQPLPQDRGSNHPPDGAEIREPSGAIPGHPST